MAKIPGTPNTDTVQSFINSYTLGANIENLVLYEGTPAINGTGNNSDNFIYGNTANNDFNYREGDKVQVSRSGMGANSPNEFQYNNSTGALSFKNQQFAKVPGGFRPDSDIVFVP